MEENVFNQIEKKVQQIEKEHGSFENFVVNSTNLIEEHRMRMRDVSFSHFEQMQPIYAEMCDLEIVDLLDYQNFVGRFDGEFS